MIDLSHCTVKYSENELKSQWQFNQLILIQLWVWNFLVKKLFGWAVVLNEITLTVTSAWRWHHHAVWGAFLVRTGQTGQKGASWEPDPQCQDTWLGRRFTMSQQPDPFGSLWRHVTVAAHRQSLTTLTEIDRICREEWQNIPSSTLLCA